MVSPLSAGLTRRAAGSRFAGVAPAAARRTLAAFAALLLLVSALGNGAPALPGEQSAGTIGAGLAGAAAGGGDYYLAAVEALHAAGRNADPLAVRLPSLDMLAAAVPGRVATASLWLLALGTALAWYRRLAGRTPRLLAAGLPLLGMAAVLQPGAAALHESWAGLLVAASLAVAIPGRGIETVALGLAAALVDQAAIVYLLAMLAFAFGTRRRREALGWATAIGAFAIVFAVHAYAVARAGGDAPLVEAAVRTGLVASLRAAADATALGWLPAMIAVPLLVLALAGWAVPGGRAGLRVATALLALGLTVAIGPAADAAEAALLVAPVSLVGLAFAAPALRDLAAAALDRRRITVTRVVR